jgi:hypothetical protein
MNIKKLTLEQLQRERRRWYKIACRQADYGNWGPTNRLREIELEIERREEMEETDE